MSDYSVLDKHPFLLQFLFYPRKSDEAAPAGAFDLSITVQEQIVVGCRLFEGDPGWKWLLYFHGNGEIAADYNEIAPLYHRYKINLAVADFRGYGQSGGKPTFAGMVSDARVIFKEVRSAVVERGYKDNLWVMGRSMGSISALELAAAFPLLINGVIFESGFISVVKLIGHLGLPSAGLDLEPLESMGRRLAAEVKIPALIIHGEKDSLVPYEQAEDLYGSLGSQEKELVAIPDGDHNNLMLMGQETYFDSIARFIDQTASCDDGK